MPSATARSTVGVGVAVRAVGSGASLVVEDDGPGEPTTEDLPHVFERFYRAEARPGVALDSASPSPT